MHLAYARYLARHKFFVLRAGLRTRAPLWRLIIHDWSKLLPIEWFGYARFFYGNAEDEATAARHQAAFDRAWLHHQHRNPHHWQHFVLRLDDGGSQLLPMPEKIVREMVADWMGAGRAITGAWDVASWYARKRDVIQLHPATRKLVESLLALV